MQPSFPVKMRAAFDFLWMILTTSMVTFDYSVDALLRSDMFFLNL